MDSLLRSYRREKSREKKSRITGSGRGDIYKSNWYAYEAFSFMGDRNHPGNTQDTLDEENANHSETRNDNSQNDQVENENLNATREMEEQEKRSTTKIKKRTKRNETEDLSDNAISEALTLLQQCASDNAALEEKDHYDVYGQYIANELRKYDAFTLAHVKHAINKIIFEADIGVYHASTAYYTQSYSERNSSIYPSSSSSSPMPPNSPKPPISPMPPTSPMPPNSPTPPTLPMAFTSSIPPVTTFLMPSPLPHR